MSQCWRRQQSSFCGASAVAFVQELLLLFAVYLPAQPQPAKRLVWARWAQLEEVTG